MIRRPPRSTLLTHSFPNRRSSDLARVSRHWTYFDRLWNDEIRHLSVMPFPEAARRNLCSVAHESLDSALAAVRQAATDPRHPRVALKHQEEAIANWKAAGQRGVFQHATGSGKTFTAILAIREHVAAGLPALVIVPSALLLRQWEGELREEIPNASLVLAGGDNNAWRTP